MTKNRVHINQTGLDQAIENARVEMEKRMNRTLQDTIREVRDEMEGGDPGEIYEVLMQRLQERIPGFKPDEENFRQFAQAIADGQMGD